MKKIFRIAAYDYKRIMLNPITLICLIIVLAVCMLVGFVSKPQITPAYTANISGETTRQMYDNFLNSKDPDTKANLDAILTQAKAYLNVQEECFDQKTLRDANNDFQKIKSEVEKYKNPLTSGSCIYLSDISEVKTAAENIKKFTDRFATLDALESDLIFTKTQFETLKTIANTFYQIANSTKTNAEILDDIYENLSKIDQLNDITKNTYTWDCDPAILETLQIECITKAETKLSKIYDEIQNVYNASPVGNTDRLDEMKSLITNYKLTCESAKFNIESEFKLLLEKRFNNLKNLYHFETIILEDTKLGLTKTQHFLNDQSLYYTQHQTALNFQTASYQITLYDYSYMIVSIVGFLTILFGIFCTYKLFGRDRKNGKMDTILAQDVTFNQVFVAKFLAVIMITLSTLAIYMILSMIWGALIYGNLPNSILAVFNLSSIYTIHPFLFMLIKVVGIELQVIFYSTITVFLMNISRKFDLMFAISLVIFAIATTCNIFLNNSLAYCLFPFIHSDITSFLGGATMSTGFLKTALYTNGNFFISLAYYLVFVLLLFNFTKNLFKKN